MTSRFLACLLLLVAVLPAPALCAPTAGSFADSAAPVPETTFETTLGNGLKLIVKEDHRAPTVVHMVWYRAGSIDEKDGSSGVAHDLEHLMFKGTRNLPAGEFNKQVAAAGGRDNAFTSHDYTAYFQIVPKAALARMMQLEADRMQNLAFTPKEFASEMKVVMEERRWRTEDNPQSLVHENLRAVAFTAHPYRRPVIGWMDDLEHLTWQDARDWYTAWYAPNNAYVVVVGDVDHRQVFRLAEKYYGRFKPRALPERKPQNEPEQIGIRRLTVKAPAKLPYLAMLWKVPKLKDPRQEREPFALEVLAAVLDGHDAARLARHLVRGSRIAQSAGAGYDGTLRGEASFLLDGQPAEGHTVVELEAALREEIARIQNEGVSAEELQRIKIQLVAAQTYKRDSLMAQAMEIGSTEGAGLSWRDIDLLVEKIKDVRAEEVQAVAKKYFVDDHLTVAVLDPQPIDETRPKPPPAGLRH
ncbi:MAG: peptidase M16 [Betaproteobacteria bacterium HGW-Betaproteobacteria-11]|nr:MAG: peptidase M16 [Betaproteobacteria bacterium HGW-Betaproteobacteria-11]